MQGPKCHPQGHASHVAASLPLGSPANTFSCLRFQAVEIGIGSFAVVPTHATVAEGKVLPIERPMFILNKPVKMFYSLESEEAKIPGKRMGSFPCSGLTIWLGASTSNTANKDSSNLQSAECGHRCGSPPPCSSLSSQPGLLSSSMLQLAAHSRRQSFAWTFLYILEMWMKLKGGHCPPVLP